jgi:hypothetical protein
MGLAPGKVTVSVKVLGVSGALDLRVLPRLGSVMLAPADTQLVVGDSAFIRAIITDADGHQLSGLSPEWRFGDPTLAASQDVGVPGGLWLIGLAPGSYVLGIRIAHLDGTPARVEIVGAP